MFVSSARGWVLTPVQMRAGVSTACRFLISAAVFCVVVNSRLRGCCINPNANTATLMAMPISTIVKKSLINIFSSIILICLS